ncbi:MAG TPA: L,D-transpeptidase family protein [Acidimicrobiales bacterium]|nr:L,D-transpeptidase family protein [Acidimicrobiales bacterium]
MPGPSGVAPAALGPGGSGPEVSALQAHLVSLGYWLGPTDGSFGLLTEQAVLAVQKAAGLAPDGVVGPATERAIEAGTRPVPRSAVGSHIEVDLTRQLVLVVSDGHLEAALNTSTGNGQPYVMNGARYAADTPTGTFTVFRRVDGWDTSPLGLLWRPAYFVAGVALHGYEDVPARPASHGCVRVSIPAMDWLWSSGHSGIGTPVLVY